MIAFLTLIYIGILFLAVKIGIIKLNAFWKVSPVLWMAVLFLVLFVPMQWGAPAGAVNAYQTVIEVVPNVTGEVTEIQARPMQKLQKGDPIFSIDPTQYQAKVEQIEAQIALSQANLERAQEIMNRGVGRQVDIDIYQAEVSALKPQLENALWELDRTVVRAPENGKVVALSLRPGQRVANLPLRSWVAFVGEGTEIAVGIPQSRLRFVEVGQEAEVTLRLYPGQILKARVDRLINVNPAAQLAPSGILPMAPTLADPAMPFAVVLKFDADQDLPFESLAGGAVGTAAIYTDSVAATHMIRRVMIRMDAWMNYLVP